MTEPDPIPPRAGPGGGPDPDPDRRAAAGALGCFMLLLVPLALGLLWWRERLPLVAEEAMASGETAHVLGSLAPWASLGAGLATGLLLAGALDAVSRYLPAYRNLEARLGDLLGRPSDRALLWLALISAVGEELFFRLALRDTLGPIAALAVYVVLNTGRGLGAWALVALVSGAAFTGLMVAGFGLLAATTAHAVLNYLTLRRMLLY